MTPCRPWPAPHPCVGCAHYAFLIPGFPVFFRQGSTRRIYVAEKSPLGSWLSRGRSACCARRAITWTVRHNAGRIGNLYLGCQKMGVIRNSSEVIVRCGVRHFELAIGDGYSVSSWPSPSICTCQSSSRTAIGFSRQFSATLTNSPR
jgi:hypothetical protein